MEKISIVALRKEKNRDLETAALLRARQRTALQESIRAIERPFHPDPDPVLHMSSDRSDLNLISQSQPQIHQKAEQNTQPARSIPMSKDEFTFDVDLEPEQLEMIVDGLEKDKIGNCGNFYSDNGTNGQSARKVIFRFNVKQVMPGRILTTREACKILRISTRTIYRYIRSGSIEAYKLGAELRFREQDIYRFLLENKL